MTRGSVLRSTRNIPDASLLLDRYFCRRRERLFGELAHALQGGQQFPFVGRQRFALIWERDVVGVEDGCVGVVGFEAERDDGVVVDDRGVAPVGDEEKG